MIQLLEADQSLIEEEVKKVSTQITTQQLQAEQEVKSTTLDLLAGQASAATQPQSSEQSSAKRKRISDSSHDSSQGSSQDSSQDDIYMRSSGDGMV